MNIGYMEVLPNGQIVSIGNCPEDVVARQQPHFGGEIYVLDAGAFEAVDASRMYFAQGAFYERPVITSSKVRLKADGIDEITINAPYGSKVVIDDILYEVDDANGVALTTDMPGTMKISIEPPFPYMPFQTEIEAYED